MITFLLCFIASLIVSVTAVAALLAFTFEIVLSSIGFPSLEEKIALLIARKAAVSERVVGSGEGWLTELSSTQLRELVALSPEAVAE